MLGRRRRQLVPGDDGAVERQAHARGVVHDGQIWIVGAENGTPDDVWKSKDGVTW